MDLFFNSPADGVASFPATFSVPEADLEVHLRVSCNFVYEPGEAPTQTSPGVPESVSLFSIHIYHLDSEVCRGVLPMLQFSSNAFEEEILRHIREKREEFVFETQAEEALHASL